MSSGAAFIPHQSVEDIHAKTVKGSAQKGMKVMRTLMHLIYDLKSRIRMPDNTGAKQRDVSHIKEA